MNHQPGIGIGIGMNHHPGIGIRIGIGMNPLPVSVLVSVWRYRWNSNAPYGEDFSEIKPRGHVV